MTRRLVSNLRPPSRRILRLSLLGVTGLAFAAGPAFAASSTPASSKTSSSSKAPAADSATKAASSPTPTPAKASGDDKDIGDSISSKVKEIFNFSRGAVVKIQSCDEHGEIEGTGFYADPSGTIYTVMDVVGDGTNITVCQGMQKLPAHLLVADPRTGIALIKVDSTSPFIPIGDSSKLEVTTPLITMGYPMDKPISPAFGLVAGFDKQFLNHFFRTTLVRANLPVQPGLGGAPVLNLKGEVVGIVVSFVDGNAGCYVFPINAAEKIRQDYARFNELRPGWVGMSVEPAKDAPASSPTNARIVDLQPDSPAARAGIRDGDLLMRVGDVAVRSPEDIFDASFYLTAGDDTTISVLRNGVEQKFNVRATDNPYTRTGPQEMMPDRSTLTFEISSSPSQ